MDQAQIDPTVGNWGILLEDSHDVSGFVLVTDIKSRVRCHRENPTE